MSEIVYIMAFVVGFIIGYLYRKVEEFDESERG